MNDFCLTKDQILSKTLIIIYYTAVISLIKSVSATIFNFINYSITEELNFF